LLTIKFEIKSDIVKPVIDKRGLMDKFKAVKEVFEPEKFSEGKEVLNAMYENYKTATIASNNINKNEI
jgi:hypothetical protein